MPLHLLGKKSWNVYNTENVDRVRRDEAAARSAEQALERNQKEQDAHQRLQLLRGENISDRPADSTALKSVANSDRKRKRSTDEDNRSSERGSLKQSERNRPPPGNRDRSRRDDLTIKEAPSYPEDNRSARKGETSQAVNLDQISNMRFRDAAGKHSDSRGPWYTQEASRDIELPGKDVWGNEDPGRKARSEQRTVTDDPLVAMKKGVRQLKEAEKHRKEWMQQRERDLNEVEILARAERRRVRRNGEKHRHRSNHRLDHRHR